MMMTPTQEWVAFLHKCDYTEIKLIGNRWFAVLDLLYTAAIVGGMIGDRSGYDDRWCYHTHASAKASLEAWNGAGEPLGWHRHPSTGRRRVDGLAESEYIQA